ncbi:Cyclic phosphodiesterase [Capsicum annuum]|nr:Cyclic phosphodiesterase [Capsicum annuum]
MQKVKLTEAENKTDVYSVWGLPSEEVSNRVKKLMNGLRSEFGGAQFEPHVTVVGAIKLSEEEARDKFRKGCGEVKKVYSGTVEKVDVGTFFYQCVYLLLHPTTEAGSCVTTLRRKRCFRVTCYGLSALTRSSRLAHAAAEALVTIAQVIAGALVHGAALARLYSLAPMLPEPCEFVPSWYTQVHSENWTKKECYSESSKFLQFVADVNLFTHRSVNMLRFYYLLAFKSLTNLTSEFLQASYILIFNLLLLPKFLQVCLTSARFESLMLVFVIIAAYMPHMSLLYADLTDEEKKKAQEKAYILDESIDNMSFQITRLALYKTDTEDKSLESWEKIEEYNLSAN